MYKVINNIGDFRAKLRSELRNPYNSTLGVRILIVDSFQSLINAERELIHSGGKLKYLENYVISGKNWLSLSDVKNIIECFIEKNEILYLFSLDNLLRFYSTDELNSFLSNILRTRTNKGYVILLLAGLKERIRKIEESHGNLIYKMTTAGEKIKMFVLNPEINFGLKCIEDLKEFLSCWKYQDTHIYVKHKVVYANYKKAYPDTAVDVIGIENYKDILKKVTGFRDEIYFTDEKFEIRLVEEVLKNNVYSFKDMFPYIKRFGDFVRSFLKEKNKFKRKSLINLAYNHMSDYRNLLTESNISLLKRIYKEQLGRDEKYEFLHIALETDSSFESLLCEELKEDIKKENIVGILECEKKKALEFVKRGEMSLEELKTYFKDFSAYLDTPMPSNLENKQRWVLEYMNLYKISKLQDKVLSELECLLTERNENFYNWYYSFKWVLDIAKEWKNETERIIWIDALGFEWAGFILNYLKNKEIPVHAFYICRANIPSISEINKPDFEVLEIHEFDSLIHQRYEFPDSIIRQMNSLKEILDSEVNAERKTLIFSDHGSSALVRLHKPIKLPVDVKFEHGGRYFKGHLGYECEKIIKHMEGGQEFHVAKTHVPIVNKPQGETHGGATPEEVLTFALIVGGREELSYSIEIPEREVSRRKNKLVVYIRPVLDVNVEFSIDGKPVKYERYERQRYLINLAGIKSGEHILEIRIGSNIYREQFRVIGGLEEEFPI